MILIFTIKYDFSSTSVVQLLTSMGYEVVRINADDSTHKFERISDGSIYFKNTITNKTINLSKVTSCWWRRAGLAEHQFFNGNKEYNIDQEKLAFLREKKVDYFYDEYLSLKEYIFNSIYNSTVINLGRPQFNLNRLLVLDIARSNNLKVPDYELVVSGNQLFETKKTLGPSVTKAISNGVKWESENYRFYTYTELLEDSFYERNGNVTFFPSLITSLIEKELEIRTFYIDGSFFSMAIFSQSDKQTSIDFRKYSNNRNEPYKLPFEVEAKLENIFRELKLNCGSADLILDKNGEYIFLEINPVGQYAMTSIPCNYNLDRKIANYLINGNIRN
ncbi:grasp-with-spasm system ATP-grasp peptide maturase [Flavobacterium psychroterrae]|uniref:Grasp-with-spasm system ATP-grasp peptide maturase n=1 Tax=Flavobacterium psychroterrae TaxID=2133767 RepID=A0ABS5PIS0_9FLAO|nr:grasp-with-spasm system ATP-grasp peptide maturase [Flavobacterium psychroterrae]MBS7234127.1 grasp-with-spasm system ATP-grasp peptide maturase [Flavobacterium psychroterrae]